MDASIDNRKPRAIILAAGRGSRMGTEGPKVLHPFRGRMLIAGALEAARAACGDVTVVVGYAGDVVAAAMPEGVRIANQPDQRGTGHAVACALAKMGSLEGAPVVVLPGDHPFVHADLIERIVAARASNDAAVALATVTLPDFSGDYAQFSSCGRIVRDGNGLVSRIVESKDASSEEAAITEVNVSYYCFRGEWLAANVWQLVDKNASGEFYLTDLVARAAAQSEPVVAVALDSHREGMGVNTPEQLAVAELV